MNPANIAGEGAGSSQACAACKYQRRKCSPSCSLAPYFPADRQKDFLNTQKLFGVSNIKKILKNVKQNDKETAMKSMIYQANMRAIHPVGGCCHVIRELESHINFYKAELDFVRRQIAICRAQALQDEIQKLGSCQKLGFDSQQVQVVEDGMVTTWEDQPSLAQKMEMEDLKPHLAAFKERQLQIQFQSKESHLVWLNLF
ncbi:LOB domain-containing protein 22-like [Forsythia ovata]|uniref:LOB domain-containing protein 22-like n=1 Tax=Forsythia ovata TaxID=205694 RepID=A0ABD1WFR5_9LAMI